MDVLDDEEAIQEVLGRSDFVGGIDNEALDFSQLEHFINDDTDDNHTYFSNTLSNNENVSPTRHIPSVVVSLEVTSAVEANSSGTTSTAHCHHSNQVLAKTAKVTSANSNSPSVASSFPQQNSTTVVVDGTVYSHATHNLPESPPDSGSEPPYSPQAHSPHRKVAATAGLQELLLNSPISIAGHQSTASITNGLYNKPPVHTPGIHIHASETVLVQHPTVLTPLLTHQQQQLQQTATIAIGSSNALSLAAAHAGLPSSEEHSATGITAIYTSLNSNKKRKFSEDSVRVKQETELCNDDELSFQEGPGEGSMYLDSTSFQCIRFQPFQQTAWQSLCDQNLKELPLPHYRVDADKGFNFSNADDAFVCQKKNHFQITCHTQLQGDAQFVKTGEGLRKISSFHLHFYGVKVESPSQKIKVEQSQSDRSKKAFHPVSVDLRGEQVTKVTVGRLHFSETTSNNMRKKGKPNPDQRYFNLVVGLHAHCNDNNHYPIISYASERIIVRASNPGQFESDVELCWQRGTTNDSIYHAGKVGINTDRPDEALVVHGNLKVTGHIVQPSDVRLKKDIQECDSKNQLHNLQQLRVVKYKYDPLFSQHCGVDMESDIGIIAQELQNILPDAVIPAGDILLPNGSKIDNLLVVNKERILMESVGAVKELCKVTDNLENRIDELEKINRRLVKLKRFDSIKSVNSTFSSMTKQNINQNAKKAKFKQDNAICYDQMIQITIIILILIMTFCLLSMTTLYFMELKKKTQTEGYRRFVNVKESKRIISGRLLSTTVSLFFDSTDHSMNETAVTSYTKNWFTTPDRVLDENRGIFPADAQNLENVPSSIGRTGLCTIPPEFSHQCQIICCDDQVGYKTANSYHYGPHHHYHVGRGEITSSTNTIEEGREMDHHGRRRQGLQKEEPWLKNHPKSNIVRSKRNSNDEWSENSNSENLSDSEKDLQVIVSITGLNFSCTLGGSDNCDSVINYSFCANLHASNFSYVVPIRNYITDPYLIIGFMFPNNRRMPAGVVQCTGIIEPVKCICNQRSASLGYNIENSHYDSDSRFKIEIVSNQAVSLRYRIPLMESKDLCTLEDEYVGTTFIEYNIYLFKDCESEI